jgi:hypothetical protein
LSSTVTTVVQVLTLPFTSVTVSVSVLAPTSEQTNAVWLSAKLAMAQLSEEPLLTKAAVVLPFPVASSCTVTFWQSAIGLMVSSIVTWAVQVLTVVVHVRHGQGHGVAVDIGAVEGRDVERQAGNPAGIAAAVVDLGRGDGGITRGIELNRDVLADGNRVDIVLNRHHGGAGADIAIHIGHGQCFSIGTDF